MIDQALVLAAGYGKRMRPITDSIPKPMIEIQGRSMIYRMLDKLLEYGIKSVVINAYYKKELLKEHINEYVKNINNPPKITILEEDELLETGGGIINALRYMDKSKPFFVSNSDSVFMGENIFSCLNESWVDSMNALMLLVPKEDAIGYDSSGDFALTESYELTIKKNPEYVFSGVHITHPKLFENIELSHIKLMDIYENYLENSTYKGFHGKIYEGQWFHVGTPEALDIIENSFNQDTQTP